MTHSEEKWVTGEKRADKRNVATRERKSILKWKKERKREIEKKEVFRNGRNKLWNRRIGDYSWMVS